jgi:amino acid transporter, AAT family
VTRFFTVFRTVLTPLFPWMPVVVGVVLEVIALVVLAFNLYLFGCLYLSVPALLAPMIIYWVGRRTGRFKSFRYIKSDEKSFSELFPDTRANQ